MPHRLELLFLPSHATGLVNLFTDEDIRRPRAAMAPDCVPDPIVGAEAAEQRVFAAPTYPQMRVILERELHDVAHGHFAPHVSSHVSFRDPFVFLLHSNIDRVYARWQTDPDHPARLDPARVYGAEAHLDFPVTEVGETHVQNLDHEIEPWSTGVGGFQAIRPWESIHENLGIPHTHHDALVVRPRVYDTTHPAPADA